VAQRVILRLGNSSSLLNR